MSQTLFRSAKIIDPQSPHHHQLRDIRIDSEGFIQEIGRLEANEGENIIEWEHKEVLVSPGWLDMEVHLNSPGFEFKESLEDLAEAALKGGFTSILCYPNTHPPIDNANILQSLMHQAQAHSLNFIFSGSLSENNAGKELAELFEMAHFGAKAFTEGPESPLEEGLLSRSLRYLSSFQGLLISQPILPQLSQGGQINEGIMSLQLGMLPIPEAAETAALLRDLEIVKYENGRVHFQPISSPKALDYLAKFRKDYPEISVGLPIYYLAFSEEDLIEFDTNLKVFPPLRNKAQIQQIIQHLKADTIDVLTSAHRAQGLEEKRLEFALAEPGMIGLQTFLPLTNKYLVQAGVFDWEEIVKRIAIRPREILKLPPVSIQQGQKAELTFFDPTKSWTLNPSDIPSRAKNSPLIGEELIGKPLGCWVNGSWCPAN